MFSPAHPLQMFLGLIVWSAWFVTLYGGLGVICEVAPPDPEQGVMTWVNALVLVIGLLLALVLLFFARRCWRVRAAAHARSDKERENQRFIASAAAGVYLIGAFATLAVALPAIILAPCV